jgi:hypothetical protein
MGRMKSGTIRNRGLHSGMEVYPSNAICELQISTSKDRMENEKYRNAS